MTAPVQVSVKGMLSLALGECSADMDSAAEVQMRFAKAALNAPQQK